MKRGIDVSIAVFACVILAVPALAVAVLVKVTSPGPVLYWSDRIGRYNRIFRMPKFRTMLTQTPEVATHLLRSPKSYLTPVGSFLRRSSLDELPQLWSVLVGDMSLVGPRPALFNQYDLIALRTEHSVDALRPGITGWAQVNGRDQLSILEKVDFDVWYLHHKSLALDFRILGLTVCRALGQHGVSH